MAARNVRYEYRLEEGVGGGEGGLTPAGNGNHMVSIKPNVRWPSLATTSACTKVFDASHQYRTQVSNTQPSDTKISEIALRIQDQ